MVSDQADDKVESSTNINPWTCCCSEEQHLMVTGIPTFPADSQGDKTLLPCELRSEKWDQKSHVLALSQWLQLVPSVHFSPLFLFGARILTHGTFSSQFVLALNVTTTGGKYISSLLEHPALPKPRKNLKERWRQRHEASCSSPLEACYQLLTLTSGPTEHVLGLWEPC